MKRNRRYEADVLKSAEENHIWLNALHCIVPTQEFKLKLADDILRMLKDDNHTIPSSLKESVGLDHQRVLIVRISKS